MTLDNLIPPDVVSSVHKKVLELKEPFAAFNFFRNEPCTDVYRFVYANAVGWQVRAELILALCTHIFNTIREPGDGVVMYYNKPEEKDMEPTTQIYGVKQRADTELTTLQIIGMVRQLVRNGNPEYNAGVDRMADMLIGVINARESARSTSLSNVVVEPRSMKVETK